MVRSGVIRPEATKKARTRALAAAIDWDTTSWRRRLPRSASAPAGMSRKNDGTPKAKMVRLTRAGELVIWSTIQARMIWVMFWFSVTVAELIHQKRNGLYRNAVKSGSGNRRDGTDCVSN